MYLFLLLTGGECSKGREINSRESIQIIMIKNFFKDKFIVISIFNGISFINQNIFFNHTPILYYRDFSVLYKGIKEPPITSSILRVYRLNAPMGFLGFIMKGGCRQTPTELRVHLHTLAEF